MTIVTQNNMFEEKEIEKLGDLERLYLCLESLEKKTGFLIYHLDTARGKGRRDYSNLVLLRLFVAMKIFGHRSVASFRRELLRNSQLRVASGLLDAEYEMGQRKTLVPSEGVLSRFLKRLMNHIEEVEKIMEQYVEDMYEQIEGFGKIVAGDGKIIQSFARGQKQQDGRTDARSENDATYTKKQYHSTDKDGNTRTKTYTYYGFRVHVIVDVKTELPIQVVVLPANRGESPQMRKMIESLKHKPKYILLDRGYDAQATLDLCRGYGCVPIIDNREYNKGESVQYKQTKIWYDEKGNVFYDDEAYTTLQEMKYVGYDRQRDAIRYEYKGKVYRFMIKENPKVFNQVARGSAKFKKLYSMRTSVERYNGRLDRDYMFENHCIRGLKKMRVMVTLTNIVMLAMAEARIQYARVKNEEPQYLASLTKMIV